MISIYKQKKIILIYIITIITCNQWQVAKIYKQNKSINFHRESQDPHLTTSLKCQYRKILSYGFIALLHNYVIGESTIPNFKFVLFVVFEM